MVLAQTDESNLDPSPCWLATHFRARFAKKFPIFVPSFNSFGFCVKKSVVLAVTVANN